MNEMQVSSRVNGKPLVGAAFGARIMLMSDDPGSITAQRLSAFGCLVDTENEFYAALSSIIDDPMGYDLFVMECDGYGGIPAGERAIATLIAADARMRVMLISREFDEPALPMGRRTAVCLGAPLSDAHLRLGYDHALRDRLAWPLI